MSGDRNAPASISAGSAVGRGQTLLALLLFLLALGLPLVGAIQLWPLTAVGGVITALLVWGAFRDESIAGPVIGLVLTAVPPMFVGDAPALGSLAGVVLAIALGEHLSVMQHTRYSTPGHAARTSNVSSMALHAAVAFGAIVVTLAATLVPAVRVWSVAAVVALGVIALATRRRRSVLDNVPLPPPEQFA